MHQSQSWHCPVCGQPTRVTLTRYSDDAITHTHTHADGTECQQVVPLHRGTKWLQA